MTDEKQQSETPDEWERTVVLTDRDGTVPVEPGCPKPESGAPDESDHTTVLTEQGKSVDGENREKTANSAEPPPDTGGAFAAGYEVICRFAAGGVGQIAKAKDLTFDRIVAVKSLLDTTKDNPRAVEAFIEECRLNARLDHPAIVPIYGMGKGRDGRWEVTMKLINGVSMHAYINSLRAKYDKKPLNAAQEAHELTVRLEYFLKICEVIEYCHSLKIMHGDIKPENILLGHFGELYVMDWGCARRIGTTPERISGTPVYLPPEFLKTRQVSAQVDVYSLGVVLFELITLLRGRNATSLSTGTIGINCSENELNICRNYLPAIKLGARLKAIVAKAISHDPAERYASVSDLAADVRHYLYDEEVSACPDSWLRKLFRVLYRNRIRTMLVLGGIFTLFFAGIFATYYSASEDARTRQLDMVRRLRLQTYTELLGSRIEKNYIFSQSQLLLFADNLIEEMRKSPPVGETRYDLAAYKNPKTAPSGMRNTPFYGHPINLDHAVMEQLPSEGKPENWPGNASFVALCNKVIRYNLGGCGTDDLRTTPRSLFCADNALQRLFVRWADGVIFSYPGAYDEPDSPALAVRRSHSAMLRRERRIFWSNPYFGDNGTPLQNCRYPLYDRFGRYLGVAGVELRLLELLGPLLSVDPRHRVYLADSRGNVLTFDKGKIIQLDSDTIGPDGIRAQTVLALRRELESENMRIFVRSINDSDYFVAGRPIPTINAVLLQLIDANVMASYDPMEIQLQ